MSNVQEQIEYAMGKVGKKYDPEVGYCLTTPTQVASKIKEGFVKECSFEPKLGEKLIVLSPKAEPKVEAKPKKASWRKK